MLKNSLRIEDGVHEPVTCKECGKNLEESEDSDGSFCCNPIEADRTSSKFSTDLDALLATPKIGMQTIALRNKIENLQRRLANLAARCDQDERRLDKKGRRPNCQSFANKNDADNKECTCSGQMELLKEKLNFITNKLQSIEKHTLQHGSSTNGAGRVINHPIIVDEPEDEVRTRNGKVKQITKVKQNVDKKSTTVGKPPERRTVKGASPNDVMVSKV